MDCYGGNCPHLWDAWKCIMVMLTIEDNHIWYNNELVPDLSEFLNNSTTLKDVAIILKSHDATYHHCPIRKASSFIRSAEFSSDHWVGEKCLPSPYFGKNLRKRQTLIGGVLPSIFMRQTIQTISKHRLALRGVFLWADLITQAYKPLPPDWVIIGHEQDVLICRNDILLLSRSCHLPLSQELPSILRYLKRYGYEQGMPLTVLTATALQDGLPPFVHIEMREPKALKPRGLKLDIPECKTILRLFSWPHKLRKIFYSITFLNAMVITYSGWQIVSSYEQIFTLEKHISGIQIKEPGNEQKMEAFNQYLRLTRNRVSPLDLLQQLVPFIKNKAVATYLHWTPHSLCLHLELDTITETEQLWLVLRSQFHEYHLVWQSHKSEPLKGVLTMTRKSGEKLNL